MAMGAADLEPATSSALSDEAAATGNRINKRYASNKPRAACHRSPWITHDYWGFGQRKRFLPHLTGRRMPSRFGTTRLPGGWGLGAELAGGMST
jgi:hypothetical protein